MLTKTILYFDLLHDIYTATVKLLPAFRKKQPYSYSRSEIARDQQTMWASGAKFIGSCESKVLCIDWQDSSDGEGGWLVTGCNNGTVGVSWIANKEAVVRRRMRRRSGKEEQEQDLDEEEREKTQTQRRDIPEDNLACTKEACLYKSHFILRSHTGEVKHNMYDRIP